MWQVSVGRPWLPAWINGWWLALVVTLTEAFSLRVDLKMRSARYLPPAWARGARQLLARSRISAGLRGPKP